MVVFLRFLAPALATATTSITTANDTTWHREGQIVAFVTHLLELLAVNVKLDEEAQVTVGVCRHLHGKHARGDTEGGGERGGVASASSIGLLLRTLSFRPQNNFPVPCRGSFVRFVSTLKGCLPKKVHHSMLLLLTCLGLKSYDSYDMGAPSMSTQWGLTTSRGYSFVIISPSGNWLAPRRRRRRRKAANVTATGITTHPRPHAGGRT